MATTKKIIDKFTDLPISRQRKWQLRHPKWRDKLEEKMAKSKRKQRCLYATDELWDIITKAARVYGITKSVMVEGLILTNPALRQLGSQSAEEIKKVAEELEETLERVLEKINLPDTERFPWE